MDFLLGIDLGTTGLKTTLLDTSGKIVATEYTEYPILSPQIGYAEQNPEVWWTGLVTCCRSLQANYPDHLSNLLGIGIFASILIACLPALLKKYRLQSSK